MNNQKQEKHQDDSNKKESTVHDETATSPPPQVVYHSDVCSICMDDVSLLDPEHFVYIYVVAKSSIQSVQKISMVVN